MAFGDLELITIMLESYPKSFTSSCKGLFVSNEKSQSWSEIDFIAALCANFDPHESERLKALFLKMSKQKTVSKSDVPRQSDESLHKLKKCLKRFDSLIDRHCIRDEYGFYLPFDEWKVRSSLEQIAEVDLQTTLLHYAFQYEERSLIKFLLSIPGTDLNAIDEFGRVPFQYVTVRILSGFLADAPLSLLNDLIRSHPETFLRLSYDILTVNSNRKFVQCLFNNLQLFRICLTALSTATQP